MNDWEKDCVVQRLREYLKIPSVHPNINYDECVRFIKKQADLLQLPVVVYEVVPKKPVVVITWRGQQPLLPAILLNSHMDVVPVYEEFWSYPPFEAQISKDGYIYARGIQDMKGVGMIHLEAVRILKDAGITLKRTVHISLVPDEEIGGIEGMKPFSECNDFKALNIGFALDESVASPRENEIIVYNGERTLRQIKVTCKGEPGHGSLLPLGTAGEKFHCILNKFMRYREEEVRKLKSGFRMGEVTTVNLTKVEGGVQVNVLPESLSAYFDIRIAPQVDHDQFEEMIKSWCTEAGEGVSFEYLVKNPQISNTRIDNNLVFWTVLEKTVKDMGLQLNLQICAGATDARYVRRQGIPAISFTPIINTPMLLHAHDERVHIGDYKRGIDIMVKVLQGIANV